ncbi:MAG: FtsX-like permease family protein [Firmicutes bacterium]|nr:FtsX-like permease family protein [Bacillota bacterium]
MIFKIGMRFIRFRPVLFIGAFITLMIGAAVIGIASMGLSSAIVSFDGQNEVMIVAMSIFGTISAAIAFFIIAGTFAFGIALRRKEFALFRLVGGSGGQLGRMIMAESFVVSIFASLMGSIIAYFFFPFFLDMINGVGLSQTLMVMPFVWLPLPVAFAIAVAIANLGAFSASRKATKVSPSEVLRDSSLDTKVMTKKKIAVGSIMILLGLGMYLIAILVNTGFDGSVPIVIFGTIFLVAGFVIFSPSFLPQIGYAFTRPFANSVTGKIATSGVKTSKRKTSSLISPIITSIAILMTTALTFGAMDAIMESPPEQVLINQTMMLIVIVPSIVFSAIAIINTSLMAASTRRDEIVKMKLLGVNSAQIKIIVLKETLITIILGIGVGLGIALFAAAVFQISLMSAFDHVPFVFPWIEFGVMSGIYLSVGVVSSLIAVAKILRGARVKT